MLPRKPLEGEVVVDLRGYFPSTHDLFSPDVDLAIKKFCAKTGVDSVFGVHHQDHRKSSVDYPVLHIKTDLAPSVIEAEMRRAVAQVPLRPKTRGRAS